MQVQDTSGSDLDTRRAHAAVLAHVLTMHPLQLRLSDVLRELAIVDEFCHRDEIETAAHDLVKAGLLHRQSELVLPTPAAVLFHELTL